MHQVKSLIELSKLLNCGRDVTRHMLLEYDLYNKFYDIIGKKPKTQLKYCCICNSTNRVQTYKGKLYCKKHYNHMMRYGKIINKTIYDKNDYIFENNIVKIILRDKYQNINGTCIIDKEDYEKVKDYKWYLSHGYCVTKGVNKNFGVAIQNIVMDNLEFLDVIYYDHKNRDRLNNKKENFRLVSEQENAMNLSMKSTNTSGVTGVYYSNKNSRWVAVITYNYEVIYLGSSIDFDEAVQMRLEGEAKYFKTYSPNYNADKNAICLIYTSQTDNKQKYIEIQL